MATYWCDPFLEATTQGTGTTDTTTKNGTYAAPFSMFDFQLTSTSSQSTVGGVTFADGDELRLKGLAFTTLFESKGNVYEARSPASTGSSVNDSNGQLTAVTGNTSADFDGYNGTRSCIYAFQNSDISSYLPGWSHPLFFAHQISSSYHNDNTVLYHGIYHFTYPVVRTQMGFNSASDTGIEVFRVKDTYANPTATQNSDTYYFNLQANVKISAGWTSETAQNGYSILEHIAGFFDDGVMGGGDGNTDTYWDLGRLIFHVRYPAGSGYGYTRLKCDLTPNTDGGTNNITAPMILMNGGNYGINIAYSAIAGQTVTFPLIAGSQAGNGQQIQVAAFGTTNGGPVYKFDNFITGNAIRPTSYSTGYLNMKLGNMYTSAMAGSDGILRPLYAGATQAANFGPTTFLDNSIYFIYKPNASNNIALQLSSGVTTTYGSNLIIAGISPLTNSSLTGAANIGPHFGPVIEASGGANFLQEEFPVNASNTIFSHALFTNTSNNPITYFSVGKFLLNSNNYKTTPHNLKYRVVTAAGSSDPPNFFIISGEHNDYDGKPLSLIGNPYVAGVTPGALMYNDTVDSTDVLVVQWCAQSGTLTRYAYVPLDLAVPSYTAGSDNLRVKVAFAYEDGASNTTQGYSNIKAWHRDTTQSNNRRGYSGSQNILAGKTPSNPQTNYVNLSNVATSGQDDITSVCVGIGVSFADNTTIQKYYIVSAEIETY